MKTNKRISRAISVVAAAAVLAGAGLAATSSPPVAKEAAAQFSTKLFAFRLGRIHYCLPMSCRAWSLCCKLEPVF